MFGRLICLVIVAAMMAHCAARLGMLSYLYQKRHEIAYSVGLISEIPITTCSHDYDFGNGLVVNASGNDHEVPAGLITAHEIILFVQGTSLTICRNAKSVSREPITNIEVIYKPNYLSDIFHPPSFQS